MRLSKLMPSPSSVPTSDTDVKRWSEVRPANTVTLFGLLKFTNRSAENPFEFEIENVVEPGKMVPKPATSIPKLRIGELNVNVTIEGLAKKIPCPKAPKVLALQKSDPLQETTRLGKVTDVAVLEIGRSKSWTVWGPAAAK